MYKVLVLLVLAAGVVAGCGRAQSDSASKHQVNAVGQKYLLKDEPSDAQAVVDTVEGDDASEIVVVGRIGGAEQPFIKDLAAFTIVDQSLHACSDIEGDACPTPWDYCCEVDKLDTHSVTVKFADAAGKVLPVDARQLFGIEPLQTVVVKGKLQKDKSGKIAVVAEKMYVKK